MPKVEIYNSLEKMLSGDLSWMKNMKPLEERMDWKEFYRHPLYTRDEVLAMTFEEYRVKLRLEVNNLKEAAICLGWFDEYYGKDPVEMPVNLRDIWLSCHGGWMPDEDFEIVSWDKKDVEQTIEALKNGLI